MEKVDLHLHSNFSDGSDSIKELLSEIIKSKITSFALTDHDTIEGCKEMRQIVPPDITFIEGIELTTIADDIKCHILGYGCDCNNLVLNDLILKGKDLRKKKLEVRIEYLKNKWGIELNKEESDWLFSRKSVVKTHIANILVKRNLAPNNLSAMKKYLDGCKSGNTRFSIEESINAIISSGGIPIWAHPLGGEGEKHLSKEDFLPKLEKMITFGIKGLECFYSRYNEEEIDFLVKCANKNNLLISGGSDYHGTNKNSINIGKLNINNNFVNKKNLTILEKL